VGELHEGVKALQRFTRYHEGLWNIMEGRKGMFSTVLSLASGHGPSQAKGDGPLTALAWLEI
jgi:hypothetical protein